MKIGYFVEIWDTLKQEFTPQVGVPCGPWSFDGLAHAVNALQNLGYECEVERTESLGVHTEDPSVSLWFEEVSDETRLRHKLPVQCRDFFRARGGLTPAKPLVIAEGT